MGNSKAKNDALYNFVRDMSVYVSLLLTDMLCGPRRLIVVDFSSTIAALAASADLVCAFDILLTDPRPWADAWARCLETVTAGRVLKDAVADFRSDLADQAEDRQTMAKVIDAAGANHFPCSTPVAAQDAQEAATSATPEGFQEHDIETSSPALRMTLANIMQHT